MYIILWLCVAALTCYYLPLKIYWQCYVFGAVALLCPHGFVVVLNKYALHTAAPCFTTGIYCVAHNKLCVVFADNNVKSFAISMNSEHNGSVCLFLYIAINWSHHCGMFYTLAIEVGVDTESECARLRNYGFSYFESNLQFMKINCF